MTAPENSNAGQAAEPIRVLVCVRADTRPAIKAALGNAFDLTFCGSLAEAEIFLDEPFTLILCSLNFDDSRMFEMLELAKRHETSRACLFVCMKATPTLLSERFFESIRTAAMALGADDFIEFNRWQEEYGEGLALQMLRRHLLDLAGGHGDDPVRA